MEIEERIVRLSEQLAKFSSATHKERAANDKRIESVLTQCAPDCPACAAESVLVKEQFELADQRRKLLQTIGREAVSNKQAHRERSRKPRSRSPSLVMRGLGALVREFPGVGASSLVEILEGQIRTYDDDDVELYVVDENVLVRDLNSDATKLVRFKNLSKYLQRAKDT